jgi:hypothetical protein
VAACWKGEVETLDPDVRRRGHQAVVFEIVLVDAGTLAEDAPVVDDRRRL